MTGPYDDLLSLPHPEPRTHARMSLTARAAQFAPFAALTGFDGAVQETARRTEAAPELTDEAREELDRTLRQVLAGPHRRVRLTWFRPDARKDGGALVTVCAALEGFDRTARALELQDGTAIPLGALTALEPLEDEEE